MTKDWMTPEGLDEIDGICKHHYFYLECDGDLLGDPSLNAAIPQLIAKIREQQSKLEAAQFIIRKQSERHDKLHEVIKEKQARIDELEAQTQWLPIETAPKDGTRILAATFHNYYVVVFWDPDLEEWKDDVEEIDRYPKCWQPIKPPREGE